MDVILLIEKGSKQTRMVRLRRPLTTVGRRHGCDLRIPSARVSRRHCLLACQDDTLTVEDLDSANGTFLNGAPVKGRQLVQPGDRLTVGPVTFLIQYDPPEALHDEATAVEGAVPVADLVILAEDDDWGEELVSLEEDRPARGKPGQTPGRQAQPTAEEPITLSLEERAQSPVGDDVFELFSDLDEEP